MYKQFIFWKTLINTILVGLISLFIYLDIVTHVDRILPITIFFVVLILSELIFYVIRKKYKFAREKENTILNIIIFTLLFYGNRYNEYFIVAGYVLYMIASLLSYRHAVKNLDETVN